MPLAICLKCSESERKIIGYRKVSLSLWPNIVKQMRSCHIFDMFFEHHDRKPYVFNIMCESSGVQRGAIPLLTSPRKRKIKTTLKNNGLSYLRGQEPDKPHLKQVGPDQMPSNPKGRNRRKSFFGLTAEMISLLVQSAGSSKQLEMQ